MIDSGWISTEEPSVSRFATNPGFVSNKSPGKTTVDAVTSNPLTQTPPSLCSTADPVSCAAIISGQQQIIIQQRRLRKIHPFLIDETLPAIYQMLMREKSGGLLAFWVRLKHDSRTPQLAPLFVCEVRYADVVVDSEMDTQSPDASVIEFRDVA